MNRTLKLALSVFLGTMIVAPAFASQDNFPDVPENHWAYEAVANLKGKILFGYPDGNYRGSRFMTRYEFAVAINQLWSKMQEQFKGVQDQIAALPTGGGTDSGLKQQVDELKAQVDGMKDWGTSIADLQKLTKEFEKELTALGVDVDKMKSQIKDLDDRVTALEKKNFAVALSGNLDFLVLAGSSTSNNFGATQDGRIVGRNPVTGTPTGMSKDISVLHQATLKFAGTNTDGPKWHAALVVGNAFGPGALGNLNSHQAGVGFSDSGATQVYLQEAAVDFNSALIGQGFSATVGRFGVKLGKYLFKRSDFTAAYVNQFEGEDSMGHETHDNTGLSYYADGKYYGDGALLGFHFGKASLNVVGMKNASPSTSSGASIDPIGGGFVNQTLGLQVMFPIGDMGGLNLAYLWHDSDVITGGIDRVNTYGGELNLKFNNIGIYGAYSKADTKLGNTSVNTSDNAAYEISAHYHGGKFGLGAGYFHVENFFAAAGAWDRIGSWWNPTNVKGFNVKANFMPSSQLDIYGKATFAQGISNFTNVLASTDDKVRSFTVGLGYKMSSNFGLDLSYEDVLWQYNAGNQPKERWYGIGFNYGLANNANFSLKYMISDLDAQGVANGNPSLGTARYQGGLLSSQLSIKF